MKARKFALMLATAICMAVASISAQEVSANLALARQLNQAFVEVAEKVSPAVVVITVTQKAPAPPEEEEDDSLDSLHREFRRYFRRQFEDRTPEMGQGSGVIIRKDGYILTNRHVVDDAEKIRVRLQDGRSFSATIRGVDPQSDVAVIKIDADDLPVATLADSSKTRVGEFAIAIGAPFNLDYSVTFGHVSAKGRSHVVPFYAGGNLMDQDFVQTDANINPGNSGGPLVNIDGEVIGINTLIRGLQTGIGFAIPSNLAREISEQLIASGKFTRAWLGIGIRAVKDDPDFRELIRDVEDGVIVQSIMPNGPAAKSELRAGDVITTVDGRRVGTAQQLRDEIRGKPIGKPVTLEVFRAGETALVKVNPGEYGEPAVTVAAATRPAPSESETNASGANPAGIGLTVHALTHELAERFGSDMTPGVIVVTVDKGGPAARKQLKPGDIITSINQKPVTNPRQFREALKHADLKKGVLVNLVSGKTSRFEILKDTAD